jgi:hypothetical protein
MAKEKGGENRESIDKCVFEEKGEEHVEKGKEKGAQGRQRDQGRCTHSSRSKIASETGQRWEDAGIY